MHPTLDPNFAVELLAGPKPTSNKYNRGVVGFVTGSKAYPGAALLGVNAAHEVGIGMCEYLGPEEVSNLILQKRPETLLGLGKSRVLVVGSGISFDDSSDQRSNLNVAVKLNLPMVIDAGALDLLDFSDLGKLNILTPHAGEAERLFARFGHVRKSKDIAGNPLASAVELAEITGQVVLLKGSISVIAAKGLDPIESGPGSPHLATAGTGDVLAGIIGALVAKYMAKNLALKLETLRDIALVANQLHSEASEVAAATGRFGASAICDAISEVAQVGS